MTCGKKHGANCPTAATKVDPTEVDGRSRCIHAYCDQPLGGDGTCLDGHPQDRRDVGMMVFRAEASTGELVVVQVSTALSDVAATEHARVQVWEKLAAQGAAEAVERVELEWLEPLTAIVEPEESFVGGVAPSDAPVQTFAAFCVARGRPELISVPQEASLHRGSHHVSGAAARRAKRRQEQELALWAADRATLLHQYQQLLAAGQVRQPSRTERLIEKARGHPDRQDVQAARRILQRQGIAWQEVTL